MERITTKTRMTTISAMKGTVTTRALTCIRLEAAWSAKVEQQQGLHLDNEDDGDDNGFSGNKLLPLCSSF